MGYVSTLLELQFILALHERLLVAACSMGTMNLKTTVHILDSLSLRHILKALCASERHEKQEQLGEFFGEKRDQSSRTPSR